MKNTTKTYKTVTHGSDSYQIPFYITCTVSGLTKTYTSEKYINGKLDRFKGLANLLATYICRDALKLRKAGKSDAEIKEILSKPAAPVVAAPPAEVKTENAPEATEQPAAEPTNTTEQPAAEPAIPPTTPVEVNEENMPVAKQDKNGKWRNSKGHLISEFNLKNFKQIPYVAEAAAAS